MKLIKISLALLVLATGLDFLKRFPGSYTEVDSENLCFMVPEFLKAQSGCYQKEQNEENRIFLKIKNKKINFLVPNAIGMLNLETFSVTD